MNETRERTETHAKTTSNGPTDSERSPLLTAENLTRSFGGVPVLSSVSLEVTPGLTAIVGPNGSGKSTLLRLLAGDLRPIEGAVRYEGPDVARPIGYLPQQTTFRPSFTARETLQFYASLLGERSEPYLDRVGLDDAGDRQVNALSGGMQRLLGIAVAIVGEPPVVLLDEPTSGLDPSMRTRAFEIVASVASDRRGVVLTSHDVDLVTTYADRVILLDRGQIRAAGRTEALLERHGVADVGSLYRSIVDVEEAIHVTGVSER